MHFRRSVRGFTLLEMVLALGVFAIAAIGLMMALGATVDAARISQRDAAVRNGLENRLARMSVGRLRPYANEETISDVKFREEVRREEITNEDNARLPGFWRLGVTASWEDANGPQEWSVSHLVYRGNE